ncbi:MAG: 3'-5' exonuclease [Oscillospiraceae bacterium]|nr:3'-5' exonuclease [Oscillospiraceae bacterium]
MSRFVVFDVETPNRLNSRMSAIGITVVEDGAVTENFYSLVDPETHFDYFNTRLTGINAETVRGAPTFPELWTEIEPLMSSGILAAHNAVFDMGVLKKCLNGYGIFWKQRARYLCTVQMGRRILPGMSHKLNVLCDHYGISLDHHNAASDSRACAEILLRYINAGADAGQYIRTYSLLG